MVAGWKGTQSAASLMLAGLLALPLFLVVAPAPASAGPINLEVFMELRDPEMRFTPDLIVTQPGANVTLQLTNVGELPHTFTLYGNVNVPLPLETEEGLVAYYQAQSGNLIIDVRVDPGEERTVNFTAPETVGAYAYACMIPGHARAGMIGTMVVGVVAAPQEEPGGPEGVALRAYWIGLLGIFGMVIVILVGYFVIKYESRHHTDERNHRRRGLP